MSTFTLRERFLFDDHIAPRADGIKNWNVFAVSEDRRTFWVTSGANDGERVLVHFADTDEARGIGGGAYISKRLHSDTLIKVDDPSRDTLHQFLQRAADRAPQTTLLTPVTLRTVRETVPFDGRELNEPEPAHGIQRIVPRWGFSGLPGFNAERPSGGETLDDPFTIPEIFTHRDDWFTRSRVVLPIPAPNFAPDAKAFDMREGVYLTFPDDSYRLIPRREYFAFVRHVANEARSNGADPAPIARQGDLLFFSANWYDRDWSGCQHAVCQPMDEGTFFVPQGSGGSGRVERREANTLEHGDLWFDRHVIDEEANVVRHPEHGEIPLPGGAWTAVLMPGTSRPFARRGGLD